jgi:hypothetical protein
LAFRQVLIYLLNVYLKWSNIGGKNAIKIVLYLDNGFGMSDSFGECKKDSFYLFLPDLFVATDNGFTT